MSNSTAILISMFTLVVTILATVLGRGFVAIIPILIGVIAGYILSVCLGVVNFQHVEEMPWFAFPTFYAPEFNLSAILMILPALFVVFAEHLGHLFVTSDIVGRNLIKDPGLHRSLFADGLSNIISGFVGSTPNTTYGENMGVMAMTGVYSTWVIAGAAIFAILFSLSAVISSLYIERLLSETDSIYSLGYFYCITERKVPGRRGRAPWPYRFFYGPRAMPEAITSHAPRPGHFNLPSDTFRLPFSSESGLPPGPAYHRS
jgi:hypothetical protein